MQNFLNSRSKKLLFVFSITLLVAGAAYQLYGRSLDNAPVSEQNESRIPAQTTASDCTGNPTVEQTEGPYYTPNSPQRNAITDGTTGEKLTVTGYVFDAECQPLTNAWLDFWQADSQGNYDNTGFSLRGHQYTDENGMYRLETIVPAEYPGRPPHIHVKVQKENGQILTTQMYFPGATRNETDSIFDETLLLEITDTEDGKLGKFNFVLDK